MYTAGFLVELRIPDSMSPEQARAELKTSIAFGSAEVVLHYVLPNPPDVTDE
jgi:hypothetical protein